MTVLDWPPFLLRALPLVALAVCAGELALIVWRERRIGWEMRLLVLPAHVFQLAVIVYIAFGLGRLVSAVGALVLLAIAVRAVVNTFAILSRRGRREQ